MSLRWTKTAINASTYTAIKIPNDMHIPSVVAYVSDFTGYYLAYDLVGTNEIPYPASTPLNIDTLSPDDNESTVLYVKASAGTPDFILIANKRR